MAKSDKLLAEAQRHFTAERFEEAADICRRLLRNRPRQVDALRLLAQSQCRLNDFAATIETIEKATLVLSLDTALLRILGFAYVNTGRTDDAVDAYRRALELSPEDATIANDYGAALRQQGNLDEALRVLTFAVERMPQLAFAHWNLGEIYSYRSDWQRAAGHFAAAIRIVPDNADMHNTMAVVLTNMGHTDAAITGYQRALELRPDFVQAERNLATLYRRIGKLDEAEQHVRNILQQQADGADAANTHVDLGLILRAQGLTDAAIAENEKALSLDAHCIEAHTSLGSFLADLGRFDESAKHLEAALEVDANFPPAYQHLADLARQDEYTFSDERIAHLESLLADDDLPLVDAQTLGFALGGVFDHQGETDRAFPCYQRANDAQQMILTAAGAAFNAEAHAEKIGETIRQCDERYFASIREGANAEEGRAASDSELPIFVVGMPRSGTTLVEQIIASHPAAAAAGELYDITRLAQEMRGRIEAAQAAPLDRGQLMGELAERYLETLRDHGPEAERVVDKMWGNFVYLGLIAEMFPKARVVHCRREPVDVCFSCYLCNFESNQWAWRLEDIAAYHRQYERLMDHWRDVLPLPMHEVVYAEMVGDQEKISRRLIEFCGLEWNDACLEFYNTERSVRTASRVQVRQPIYKTAVGRAERYESHLEMLRARLKES